ncbi:hypothetical protein [Mangrovihabitans endophyticus]|uniref:hypothetical protein n=1 Tax=Mangrovihabitans endophyticus TaxID=1751298 RepID=UPI001669080E|nr:hypothetical protein [Mangrovihabitans endophyticus]
MVRRSDLLLACLLIPAMAALVAALMPVNDGLYHFAVYDDPQTPDELRERWATTWSYRYTSGVLCGHFVSLTAGLALGCRRRWHALPAAAGLALALALVAVAVAIPAARLAAPDPPPPPVRLLVVEAVAYPLWAAVGVGIGTLLAVARRTTRLALGAAIIVATPLWWIFAYAGLAQHGVPKIPEWMLWPFPSLAAGAALSPSGLVTGDASRPPDLGGAWGYWAAVALCGSLLTYALLMYQITRRAQRRRGSPAELPDE